MERFWSKVEKTEGCWNWLGNITPIGYGGFFLDGKNRRAHRVAYELSIGPIPKGLVIDHLCRNRRCVNPDHLEAVTQGENRGRVPVKTHCNYGHPLIGDNAYILPNGRPRCQKCNANAQLRHSAKQKNVLRAVLNQTDAL